MDRLRSGLLASFIAVGLGTALFAGCSADGGAIGDFAPEPAQSSNPTSPLNPGANLPDPGEEEKDDSGTVTPPKKDGGTTNKDSGTQVPVSIIPDSPCTKVNEVFEEQCGACGKHSAVCLASDPDGGASGGKWSAYSDCTGQTPGGCEPGSELEESCGNCGHRKLVCTKYCSFPNSACLGEPPDSCPAGSIAFVSAGCPANQYRLKRCKNDCTYMAVSQSCSAPPTTFDIAPTVGSVSNTIAILDSSKVQKKLSFSTCPSGSLATQETPYAYVQVRNPLPKAATVSIYNTVAPNGVAFETILAAYAGSTVPTTETARKACEVGVATYGNTQLTGDAKFASLDGTRKVTIPANGTVTIYVGAEKAFSSQAPAESTGPVSVVAKTEAIAP